MRSVFVFSPMLRVSALLVMCACGGFTTPAQEVSVGLALSATSSLPPRIAADGHVLVLSRLALTGTAWVKRRGEGELQLGAAQKVEVPLTAKWTTLVGGSLARGDYRQLRMELSALLLEGTWDGVAFRLEATEAKDRDRELELERDWRVEAGRASSLALVVEPARWMRKGGGGGGGGGDSDGGAGGGSGGGTGELIDPTSSEAAEGLIERFLQSLAAVRDDDHDGAQDAAP